jgi:hypothetical protein
MHNPGALFFITFNCDKSKIIRFIINEKNKKKIILICVRMLLI